MGKFKVLLAAFVLIPLASFGATWTADADSVIAAVGTPAVDSGLKISREQTTCCWVFWGGNWYCVPC